MSNFANPKTLHRSTLSHWRVFTQSPLATPGWFAHHRHIVILTWTRINLSLRRPFRTATALRTTKQTIWLRLQQDGLEGWGEAVPVDTYGQTLETAEDALPRIAEFLRAQTAPRDLPDIEKTVDALLAICPTERATLAAVDASLHDWLGKKRQMPVWRLLGLNIDRMPRTSFTIGIDDLETIAVKVREAADYPILKIKLGTPNDEQILATVRRAAPEKTLRVDANTAWSDDELLDRARMLARWNVEFVEQPVKAGNLAGLKRLKDARILPVIADESCVVPADVERLVGCVDGINIKMSKCGGITEARRMIAIARAHDMSVMLGCMIESSHGISAAAHLGPLVDFLDLDGHVLLANDPFKGLGGENGSLTLSDRSGLGLIAIGGP